MRRTGQEWAEGRAGTLAQAKARKRMVTVTLTAAEWVNVKVCMWDGVALNRAQGFPATAASYHNTLQALRRAIEEDRP